MPVKRCETYGTFYSCEFVLNIQSQERQLSVKFNPSKTDSSVINITELFSP